MNFSLVWELKLGVPQHLTIAFTEFPKVANTRVVGILQFLEKLMNHIVSVGRGENMSVTPPLWETKARKLQVQA